MRAEERSQQRSSPYQGFSQCFYLTSIAVLPGTYVGFTEACENKTELQTELTDSEGVTAEQCCIAWDDDSNRLWVMLNVSDSGSVEYRNLDKKDRLLFDNARGTEIRNLLELGATLAKTLAHF